MSRHRRRREEPGSSHWEPEYRRSYSDEYNRRRHGPPTAEFRPRSRFNYWREDVTISASQYPQRSYGRESYDDRLRDSDDRRSFYAESSYSRRRGDFWPSRDRDDWEPRRNLDRNPPHRDASRQRYSTYTPSVTRRTTHAKSPIQFVPALQKPSSPDRAPPPPTSPSPKPSSEYLALSEKPSEVLRDPAMARKLLVLDLNGTLLIRSPRSRTSSGPQLRPVQPRPYMQSFREYLFCPETKSWLDTMVWSSAQPHSVDDMVNKVFGAAKGELKAVWNRKSLGLSEEDYHRKTVTTKDLTGPWELFASALSPEMRQGLSSHPPQSQTIHSALSTVLLDDSPHKAEIQPYNHVCIPEYDKTRRQHDLQSFLAVKEPRRTKWKNQIEIPADSADQTMSQLFALEILTEFAAEEPYDVLLLAIIGILETVKLQSNIAWWIRNGGLWATQEKGTENGTSDVEHRNVANAEGGKAVLNSVVRTGDGTSSRPKSTTIQTRMWFEDSSIVAFWVARGRRALVEHGIQAVHGVTG